MRKAFLLLCLLIISIGGFAQDNNLQKYALVIGNGNYTGISKLSNPVNDANDMEAVLKSLGFTVDKVLNGNLDQMENSIMQLRNRLSVTKNSYGFFFYAGHGVASNGENYLIPVDSSIQSESNLRQRAVSVSFMMNELNNAGNELNIVILDACRDNPFGWSRSGSRGLSIVSNQPADSIVVYATSAGATAADGNGRNGLFTGHLLENMRIPELEITEVFRLTMGDVARDSGNQQRPAVYNQFYGTAYLGAVQSGQTAPDQRARPEPLPLPSPARPADPKERQTKERPTDTAAKLWTVGASVGTSFTYPLLVTTIRGTIAPFKYSFLELGIDGGFFSKGSDVGHNSVHPFAHLAFFYPFTKSLGFYAGAGGGCMIAAFNFSGSDKLPVNIPAADFNAGLNLFGMIDLSYTFRTDFKNTGNKVSVGYTYRFKQGEK